MYLPVYAYLLACVSGFSLVFVVPTSRDPWRYALVGVEVVSMANLWLQNLALQVLLHDAFAFFLLYGLLATPCEHVRALGVFVGTLQLATRHIYDRCIFMWTTTQRNRDCDVFLLGLLVAATLRPCARAWLPTWACACIAVVSHWMDDHPDASLLFAEY